MNFLLCFFAGTLFAGPKYVTSHFPVQVNGKAGKSAKGTILLEVENGFHIQSNPASRSNLIATKFEWPEETSLGVTHIEYPKGESYKLQGSGQLLSVYSGKVEIPIEVTIGAGAKPGKNILKGNFRYQACNNLTCFFPITEAVELWVEVKKG